jgi:hypothetical protein
MLRCRTIGGRLAGVFHDVVRGMGNGITTDLDLMKAMAGVRGFRGVFSKDEFLRKKMNVGDSAIVNLDSGWKHGGTHWVAIRVGKDGSYLYRDSFGLPPFEGLGRDVWYSNRMDQRIEEENCGQRSVAVLKLLEMADDDIELFKSIA